MAAGKTFVFVRLNLEKTAHCRTNRGRKNAQIEKVACIAYAVLTF